MSNRGKLLISLLIPQLVGIIGSVFTVPAIPGWYMELIKPSLTPPSWVFAPVWVTLFVLMGISLFLVWKERNSFSKFAGIWFFFIQLALNALWSTLFFGLQNPGAALIEIIFLWVSILATIIIFAKVSRTAAWLMLPYLVWVSFALYLNYAIWLLN